MRLYITLLVILLMVATPSGTAARGFASGYETGSGDDGWHTPVGTKVSDSNWSPRVRTTTLWRGGVELEAPVLTLGDGERLLLRFDVLGAEMGNYRYRIEHCDSQWRKDGLEPYEYMNGFEEGPVEGYESSFTKVPWRDMRVPLLR